MTERDDPTVLDLGMILLADLPIIPELGEAASAPPGFDAIPEEVVRRYLDQVDDVQEKVLGREFGRAARIRRMPLGRLSLAGEMLQPSHADVFLVAHRSGVAIAELWLPAPTQPMDVDRWIAWLAKEGTVPSLVDHTCSRLSAALSTPAGSRTTLDGCFPFFTLRSSRSPLDAILTAHGEDVVRLLYLDSSRVRFKQSFVAAELAKDFCQREGGLSLLSLRAAIDLHGAESSEAVDERGGDRLPPPSALPFLMTLELLLLERVAMRQFYQRLSSPESSRALDELIRGKDEILDALAEYSGVITATNQFYTEVSQRGEALLGIDDLYGALLGKLDDVTFAITTGYQRSTNRLQFWLTVVFVGADVGGIAAGIAALHYRSNIAAVVAWATAVALVAGFAILALIWRWVE